jgi:hypothetical protein
MREQWLLYIHVHGHFYNVIQLSALVITRV